jgi:hypothetical protein
VALLTRKLKRALLGFNDVQNHKGLVYKVEADTGRFGKGDRWSSGGAGALARRAAPISNLRAVPNGSQKNYCFEVEALAANSRTTSRNATLDSSPDTASRGTVAVR